MQAVACLQDGCQLGAQTGHWQTTGLPLVGNMQAGASKVSMSVLVRQHAVSVQKPVRAGRRYDFGQTTRVGHGLAGEERFSVQWRRDDDSVWCSPLTVFEVQSCVELQ